MEWAGEGRSLGCGPSGDGFEFLMDFVVWTGFYPRLQLVNCLAQFRRNLLRRRRYVGRHLCSHKDTNNRVL